MKLRPGTVGRKLAEAKDQFRKKVTARVPTGSDRRVASTTEAKKLPPASDKSS
jgi:hypothetical protein